MSVELQVFLYDNRLPTQDEWQIALDAHGCNLHLDEFVPTTHVGFVPTQLNGVDCGFEYFYGPAEELSDELLSVIGGRRHVASFRFFGEENDLIAASFAAAALAFSCDGVFYDPQSGELVPGEKTFEWLELQDAKERERLMDQAIKNWAHITERRCPACGAPCPEYKKSCKVCGLEIGRAQ